MEVHPFRWANNPILVVIEALVNVGQKSEDIDVLSIGTTESLTICLMCCAEGVALCGGENLSPRCSCKPRRTGAETGDYSHWMRAVPRESQSDRHEEQYVSERFLGRARSAVHSFHGFAGN